MKKTNILLLFTVCIWSFVSCGKEENPSDDLPEWGTSHMLKIEVFSRLTNEKLFNTDEYSTVKNLIRTSQNHVTVLHRIDAISGPNEIRNQTVSIAEETSGIPIFAWTRYAGIRIEGTGILVGQTIAEMNNTPVSNGCCYFSVPLNINGNIKLNFASITFENESQLASGAATLKEKIDDKTVLVGVAAKTLQNKLLNEFPEGTYRFEPIESTNVKATQLLFVLTTLKWKLNEYKEIAAGIDGISCFDLKLENL